MTEDNGLEEKQEQLAEGYCKVLTEQGFSLDGKKLLDVGCGTGYFISYAQNITPPLAECWGVEHTGAMIQEGLEKGTLKATDAERIVVASFSELQKRPDLSHYFDIIKITGVTPYADVREMRFMALTAHHLLKSTGVLLLELPWEDKMGKAFQANQEVGDMMGAFEKTLKMVEAAQRGDFSIVKSTYERVEKMREVYRKLVGLYFESSIEKREGSGMLVIASAPRAIIPDIKDVQVSQKDMVLKLGPTAAKIAKPIAKFAPPAPPSTSTASPGIAAEIPLSGLITSQKPKITLNI